jgi:hypothetical protein
MITHFKAKAKTRELRDNCLVFKDLPASIVNLIRLQINFLGDVLAEPVNGYV